jgi:effector-binding domain-containing protein
VVLAACRAPAPPAPAIVDEEAPSPETLRAQRDAAFAVSAVHWKERLEQPYVFLEHQGDYRLSGGAMRTLLEAAHAADLEPTGPPFALFFDDPGRVPRPELRARACLPVAERGRVAPGLQADVLPRALVVYAEVPGAYPEVPRAYPALFSYLAEQGWVATGPVREIYLVNPGAVGSYEELRTEVQIPWTPGAP